MTVTPTTDRPSNGPLRILLIAARVPPQIRPQAILLGKLLHHLPKYNVEIELLTPTLTESLPGVRVHLHKEPGRITNAILARLFAANPMLHTRYAYRDALRVAGAVIRDRGIDVVMSFANPYFVNILGALVKKTHGKPLVAHYSDPFVASPFGTASSSVEKRRFEVEKCVLDAADVVVFANRQLANWVLKRHDPSLSHLAHVIPHSFEDAQYPPDTEPMPRPDGRVLFRHIGAFYGPRTPTSLFRALEILRERKPDVFEKIDVELIGADLYGANSSTLDGSIPPTLSSRVRCLPIMDYRASLRAMQTADVLVSIDASTGDAIFLPSKLIDYLGARRPILCLTHPGSPADAICRESGNIVADVNSAEQVAAAIERAVADHADMKPDESYIGQFAIENIARRWADLFAGVTAGSV